MNHFKSATAGLFVALMVSAAFAQPSSTVEAEVRKVDKEAGKVTLKHGEIKNLDMPPMTMVFPVKNPAMLDKVKAGDKVRFKAEKAGSIIVVTEIHTIKLTDGSEAMPATTPVSGAMAAVDVTKKETSSSSAQMADGEVRKVDKEAKKITLKHGVIKNLDMPGMTMVFQVKDPALLEKVKVGDKIRFKAEQNAGAIVVTDIELAK